MVTIFIGSLAYLMNSISQLLNETASTLDGMGKLIIAIDKFKNLIKK